MANPWEERLKASQWAGQNQGFLANLTRPREEGQPPASSNGANRDMIVSVEESQQKPVWITDPNARWLLVRDRMGGVMGMTPEELEQRIAQGYYSSTGGVGVSPGPNYIYNPEAKIWQTAADYAQYNTAQSAAALRANTPGGQLGGQPQAPPRGEVDIYDPGKYLADLLRKQLPGQVFGTRVPRPNQVTLQNWQALAPDQQDILGAYWSAIGFDPRAAVAEMVRSWLTPRPTMSARFLA